MTLTTTPSIPPSAPAASSGPSPMARTTASTPSATSTASTAAHTSTAGSPTPSTDVAWIGFFAVLLVAVIAAAWNVGLAWRRSRADVRERQRVAFAEALKTVVKYKEMPYAIRRRSHTEPESERVRLSEIVREIQADISYHQSWIRSESTEVAAAYDELVTHTRTIAGTAMNEAWKAKPITTDGAMNIGPDLVDVRSLRSYEDAYIEAVRQHLRQR